ncbi:M23 family metallopeptidase [Cohnella sp. GCM10012308]|uniref:M23 family metallopeptidase n=1 Tax=Cohnella sp. GCM10012308 TaxID=3317329 RepID=UPI00366B6AF5
MIISTILGSIRPPSIGLRLGSLPDGEIVTLQVVQLESFPASDAVKTKHEYALPLKSEWFVFWGGENALTNYHYDYEMQRYAYDLIQVKDGCSYSGDQAKNESYHAFGQEIVAPRDGIVVQAVSDIADNEPVGTMNADQPIGNVVVLDHGAGEYSFLAHLKKVSVAVGVGDVVKKGELLGLCGNSGNSSEAHLHFQVSDSPDLFNGKSIRIHWEHGLNPQQGDTLNRGIGE